MPNPIYRTYDTDGPQEAIPVDFLGYGAITLVAVNTSDGSAATATFEFTLDDVTPEAEGGQAGATVPPIWIEAADYPVGAATEGYCVLIHPVMAVRLNIGDSESVDVQFKVLQNSTGRY